MPFFVAAADNRTRTVAMPTWCTNALTMSATPTPICFPRTSERSILSLTLLSNISTFLDTSFLIHVHHEMLRREGEGLLASQLFNLLRGVLENNKFNYFVYHLTKIVKIKPTCVTHHVSGLPENNKGKILMRIYGKQCNTRNTQSLRL